MTESQRKKHERVMAFLVCGFALGILGIVIVLLKGPYRNPITDDPAEFFSAVAASALFLGLTLEYASIMPKDESQTEDEL